MPVTDIFDRPAAPRRLLICTGPCCNGNGAAKLLLDEPKTKLLHAMNGDDMVGDATCVRRSCLGKYTGEPLAYVQPEGVWYHRLSVENLLLILRDHVLNHQPVPSLILEEDP
ncbi:MAG: (2Fe-2S) ferredoxin domain-containing protein [Methylocella sp.]